MVRKTKGIENDIVDILSQTKTAISPADLTKKILNDENPKLNIYNRMSGLVRYHLKKLNEQDVVRKEKFKNGYVYEMRK